MIYKEKAITLKNGSKAVFRSPTSDDAESFIEFQQKTSAETHFMARYPEEVSNNIELQKEKLANILKSETRVEITAFINGEIAGSCGFDCVKNHIKLRHRAVFGISVKEKFWNVGLGSVLINEAKTYAKNHSYEQLELGVFSDNSRARHVYEKLGFSEWGKVKNAYKLKDGTYRDEITMGCFL